MTVLAMSTLVTVLAWIGLFIGLVIAVTVVALFNRIVIAAGEIDAYANDILDAGLGIARNLDDVGELERTRDLGAAVPPLAVSYLKRLGAL